MLRITVVALLIAIILGAFWGIYRQVDTQPEPLESLLDTPKAYWAEAEGTIKLEEMTVPGRVRLNYLVYPDQRVVITNFVVWMDDIDLIVPFLWWEAGREPLRCTEFRIDTAIHGTLDNDRLLIPAGAKVLGRSYPERGADGQCKGEPRQLDTVSTEALWIVHDPQSDHFALSNTFETNFQGNDIRVSLEADGRFLNRPPVAELEVVGEYAYILEDGCPGTKGKPSIAPANTPEGLLIELRSTSYDPDGKWPDELNLKRPRVDLNFEQWARSRSGGFSFLGASQEIGPVLFEANQEHQLQLWVLDRNGTEGRKLCHFYVAP